MKRTSALLLALALALGACSLQLEGRDDDAPGTGPIPDVSFEQSDEAPPTSSVAQIIEAALPSVVNVRVTALQQDIFGEVEEGKGQGSGVVIDKDGIIVTNNHVVQQATEVTVITNDGRKLEGTVIGTDPERDLAVIRVEADDLVPIEFGRASALQLGDEVLAIGFPLGLVGGPTVTKGIVSAQGRSITVGGAAQGPEHLSGLIQTDAAINPGNSGGALVDLNGRLVGINVAAAGAASAENVGFAINIDSAIPVIKEILEKPPEKRAWMGVILGELTTPVAIELGLDPEIQGAVVTTVVSESPAEEAGIEQGDVITAVDGQKVANPNDLIEALTDYDPGETVSLAVTDDIGEDTVSVKLGLRPPAFAPQD